MAREVTHNQEAKRFFVREDGSEAFLEYLEKGDGTLDYAHTFTPEELRGRGIAGDVVGKALAWAKENDKKVIPSCPFVQTYLKRHKEYESIIVDK
ncbi:MAG: GNAT family N-acetyltransferase [Spirochaetales bacterium]